MFKLTNYICLAIFLTACAGSSLPVDVAQTGALGKAVRQDLYVKVDNVPSVLGTVVAPFKREAYVIKIASSTPMDVVFIESCQRQWIEYNKSYEYSFEYKFNGELEELLCPVKISTLEKTTQKKEYATIAFEHPGYKLSALVRCNGKVQKPVGVGLCQGKREKLQGVEFEEPVRIFSKCPLGEAREGKKFALPLATGACSYAFSTLAQPFKKMVFFTLGYEDDEYAGVPK